MAGLTAADRLAKAGCNVTVFDKGRGPGGRMSTRRTSNGLQFDHGCQYFSARTEIFQRTIDQWVQQEVAAKWSGKIVELQGGRIHDRPSSGRRFVGVPAMNAICKHLAKPLAVKQAVQINRVERNMTWRLFADEEAVGAYDYLVIAIPAVQAIELLEPLPIALKRFVAPVEFHPCWAGMFGFENAVRFQADAAIVKDSALAWICRESRKPQRSPAADCWTVHASPEWSRKHVEMTSEEAAELLAKEFFRVLRVEPQPMIHQVAHRWRYAIPAVSCDDACLFDAEMQLAICGDWCDGNRVEAAFLSGMAAADRLLEGIAR